MLNDSWAGRNPPRVVPIEEEEEEFFWLPDRRVPEVNE
jgi:hypothetical protein